MEELTKEAEKLREALRKMEQLPEKMQVTVTAYLGGMVDAYKTMKKD